MEVMWFPKKGVPPNMMESSSGHQIKYAEAATEKQKEQHIREEDKTSISR